MMPDVSVVKSNISKMIEQNAPESDIDAYVASEGMTPEQLKQPKKEKPIPSTIERIFKETARQVGLTGRYAVEGAAALPSMIGDIMGQDTSKRVSGGLTSLGFPEPQGGAERIVGDVTRGMAGAATGVGLGGLMRGAVSPVAQGIGATLQASPGLQVAAGATSGAAAGGTREMGGGPVAQTVAGMAGAMAPVGVAAVPSAARRVVRGPIENAQAGADRTAQFADAGTTPSAGQAFQTHQAQATESFLARNPGSHGTMRDFAMKQAAEVGQKVDEVAGILSGKTSPMIAGRAIEDGIKGEGGFLDHFKAVQKALYDKLDNFIKPDQRIDVTATKNALAEMNQDIPGAPALSRFFKNAKIQGIESALKSDTETASGALSQLGPIQKQMAVELPGAGPTVAAQELMDNKMPYEAIKKLRTLVGNEVADANLLSDVPRSKWKTLYAALSRDLEAAAVETGKPEATNAMRRANAYTKAGHDRIDNILKPIIDRDAPEKIFQAALSGSKAGDTTIRSVMQSLPPENQKIVAGTILRKLGMATAGKQTAEGDLFSVQTYLTNWNNISPEAKRSLFSRFGPQFVKSLDQITKTTSDIVESGRVYANPSGTAPAFTLQHTIGGTAILLLTGHPGIAGAVITESYGSNQAAKLMTNPEFVKWLGRASTAPPSAGPILINQLVQQANRNNNPDMMKFAVDLGNSLEPSASR